MLVPSSIIYEYGLGGSSNCSNFLTQEILNPKEQKNIVFGGNSSFLCNLLKNLLKNDVFSRLYVPIL